MWTLTCVDDAWEARATCDEEPRGGVCFLPSGAETCDTPFDGSSTGSVEVGPGSAVGAFRPFTEGELVDVEVGGQGSAMVWYRVRVEGEDLPTCVRVTTVLDATAVDFPQEIVRDVVLRCGASSDMFTIVPLGNCTRTGQPIAMTLTVDVQGLGQVRRSVRVPEEAVCSPRR